MNTRHPPTICASMSDDRILCEIGSVHVGHVLLAIVHEVQVAIRLRYNPYTSFVVFDLGQNDIFIDTKWPRTIVCSSLSVDYILTSVRKTITKECVLT